MVATGTPEQIAKIEESHTGKFLRRVISSGAKRSRDGSSARSFDFAWNGGTKLARAAEEAPPFRVLGHDGAIQIHGAREHNLKNIDVKIPREQMVVITGLSGSGKSARI